VPFSVSTYSRFYSGTNHPQLTFRSASSPELSEQLEQSLGNLNNLSSTYLTNEAIVERYRRIPMIETRAQGAYIENSLQYVKKYGEKVKEGEFIYIGVQ
jgi:hypothetical protein